VPAVPPARPGAPGAPAAQAGIDVAISEDVWGQPLAALLRDRVVRREPAAWADREQLRALVAGARALLVRNRTAVDAELLGAAPRLEVVGRAGVGLDNIDVPAADELGVVVVAPLGANAVSVAEHTLALALALVRELPQHDAAVRAGGWDRRPGRELAGRTWGLLGAGATGQAVARLAAALRMRVLGCDPYADPAAARVAGVELTGLAEVLGSADVLSVHLPLTPQTRNLLDAGALALLRPGTIVVSAGRGEVVDEAALAAALHSGQVGGAGLDVRAAEPPPPGPLDGAPNVIFTPHVAGITVESQQRIMTVLAQDITAVLDGGMAGHAVGAHRTGRGGR
jgi:D-3-phosphoglycerate dehydrogenase/(S)-sulfolactate dehydrogenase